jgi:hypothetical protein
VDAAVNCAPKFRLFQLANGFRNLPAINQPLVNDKKMDRVVGLKLKNSVSAFKKLKVTADCDRKTCDQQNKTPQHSFAAPEYVYNSYCTRVGAKFG